MRRTRDFLQSLGIVCLTAVLAGLLFARNPSAPFIAGIALIPIGMLVIARLRPAPAHDEFIAMAASSNVIIESLDE